MDKQICLYYRYPQNLQKVELQFSDITKYIEGNKKAFDDYMKSLSLTNIQAYLKTFISKPLSYFKSFYDHIKQNGQRIMHSLVTNFVKGLVKSVRYGIPAVTALIAAVVSWLIPLLIPTIYITLVFLGSNLKWVMDTTIMPPPSREWLSFLSLFYDDIHEYKNQGSTYDRTYAFAQLMYDINMHNSGILKFMQDLFYYYYAHNAVTDKFVDIVLDNYDKLDADLDKIKKEIADLFKTPNKNQSTLIKQVDSTKMPSRQECEQFVKETGQKILDLEKEESKPKQPSTPRRSSSFGMTRKLPGIKPTNSEGIA